MLNPSIFKSYDIRGVYPGEIDKEAAYLIGKSFVKYTGAKSVAVGQDARLSSPDLFSGLADGIMKAGSDVVDLGIVPTECIYFAVGKHAFDGGVMITASHNPKEYNGFKMQKKNDNDIEVIRGKNLFSVADGKDSKTNSSPGKIEKRDILQDYLNHVLSFSKPDKIRPFNIVIDASNGAMGPAIARIGDKLPIKIFLLNYEPDGNFPNHSPNPLVEGSTYEIKKEIQKQKADFGFIFDGDGDRIFLIDENGWMVPADITLLILAKHLLRVNPGSYIAYNTICSKAVPEFIEKWRGIPVRTKVGFVNVREELIKSNGIMGGELSGHYCFRDNFYFDSSLISFLLLLEALSEERKKVSEIIQELLVYFKSSELNFKVTDREKILKEIKEKYSDGKQDYLDGVTVNYEDWWFNARASETEPLLRLTIEADTKSLLEEKEKELRDFIIKKEK